MAENRATESFSPSLMSEELLRINTECNQKCVFCNVEDVGYPKLSIAEVYRRLKNKPVSQCVNISGGEPTIDRDIFKYILLINRMGFRNIVLQTNAMMCSDAAFARRLSEKGLAAAFVSLHAAEAGISDSLTRTPGSFELTLKGIRNLVECGVTMTVNFVANSRNYMLLPGFVRFIHGEIIRGMHAEPSAVFPFFSLSFVQPNGAALKNKRIIPRLSDAAPYINEAFSLCREFGITFVNSGCGVPVCFTPGFEEYSTEYMDRLRFPGKTSSLSEENISNKTKGARCESCRYFDLCPGVWKNYADIYGTGELSPR